MGTRPAPVEVEDNPLTPPMRVLHRIGGWSVNAVPEGLAEQLVRAIQERRELLNKAGEDAGDHPVEVTLHYHPGMEKIDILVSQRAKIPSVKAPRRRPARLARGSTSNPGNGTAST